MIAKKQQIKVDGRELTISNLDKIFFPESGFTKGQVISFYSDIAPAILPHLRDRPLTLKRYPDGVMGEHFYEKNAPVHTPPWVKRFAVPRSEGGPDINYILCNDMATLVWATNLGDIEKHVLLAHVPDLNRPTSVVFDLDPGEPAGVLDCGEVALHLKKVFDGLKLESFVKVSGSKGLHLAVPLNTEVTYEQTQPFAKAIAELVMQQMPDRVVSEMAKTLRRGKVLIDWSQNSDFKTTVCVYAMRAKRGEPFISMPVTWAELAKAVKRGDEKPLFFTPEAAVKRIKRVGDLFEPVLKLRQNLPAMFTKALAAGPPPKLSSWPRNRSKSGQDHDKSLREYAAKRNPTQTPEPMAASVSKVKERKGIHRFVIQKHAASRLHYDWRLEMQGVLRSWAVPKGPPTKPREARLAMHVEDHPLEYADFEGTIPPGNYGAGTVMVWDQGEYEDLTGNPAAAFHQGKMHVIMRGQKLKGEWIPGEGSAGWLPPRFRAKYSGEFLRRKNQSMNRQRRKALAKIAEELGRLKDEAEAIENEEQDSFESMSPGMQEGERGTDAEEAIEALQGIIDGISETLDELYSLAEITPPKASKDSLQPGSELLERLNESRKRQKKIRRAEQLLSAAGYFVIRDNDEHFRLYLDDGRPSYWRKPDFGVIGDARKKLHAKVKKLFENFAGLRAPKSKTPRKR